MRFSFFFSQNNFIDIKHGIHISRPYVKNARSVYLVGDDLICVFGKK